MVLCVQGRNKKGQIKRITNFNRVYANMAQILKDQYNIDPEENIRIIETYKTDIPGFNGYQTKFKQVFKGNLEKLKVWNEKLCRKTIWKKKNVIKS